MTFLFFAHYTTFLLSTGLLIYILAKNPRAAANRICAALVACFVIWNFANAFLQISESKAAAMVWENISALGWCGCPAFALWLSLVLTQKETRLRKWVFYPLLLLFPAFFIGLQWTGALINDLVKNPHWWNEIWSASIWPWFCFIYIYSFMSISLYLGIAFFKKNRLIALQKKGGGIVLIATIITIILGTLSDIALPLFGIRLIPPISSIILLILASGMAYAISKYQFLTLTPAYAASDILGAMNDSLILIGPEGKIIEANAATLQLLDYSREQIIGTPVDLLLPSREASIVATNYAPRILSRINTFTNYSMSLRAKDGAQIPVSVSGSILRDHEANLIGIVGVARDQREILRLQESEQAYEVEKARTEALEERARELQEAYDRLRTIQAKLIQSGKMAAMGQLAGGVAHEINNPLGVILGFAQSLSKRMPTDDPLYRPLKSIEREAERCKKLVGDLLAFSRAGKTQAESLDINTMIADTLSLIEAQAQVKSIEIIKEYQNNLPEITAHRNQLQQVIFNLCINAIDAMPGGGVLTITTNIGPNSQLEITIRDTGNGITEAVKKRLTEPFGAAPETGARTGLGLSLCSEIIQKHHGMLEVEAEAGKSSAFKIKLPVK